MELDYKEDIIATRVGGLGSSDARMVARIGMTGELNYSAQLRIGQMLGQVVVPQYKTDKMILGDNIENSIFEILKKKFPNAVSNPKVLAPEATTCYGFDVFTHIDFEVEDGKSVVWYECKATEKAISVTLKEYSQQLAWHQMIGARKAEKAGKVFSLYLVHYDTVGHDGVFKPGKMTVIKVPESSEMLMENIRKGLRIIQNTIETGFQFNPREELVAEDLPVEQQQEMVAACRYVRELKEAERMLDEFKKRMLPLMRDNNVKSVRNELFSIFYRGESSRTTFDSERFRKEHPKLYSQYLRTSKVSDSITIKTNI